MSKTILIAFILTFHLSIVSAKDAPSKSSNIGQRTFEFFDNSRDRKLITEVWYPTHDAILEKDKVFSPFKRSFTIRDAQLSKGQFPLVLFSHGNGGSRLSLEWLAQELVKQGYIVAAVDHWGNTHDNKIGIEFIKPWERPLDVSFILTALLEDHTFSKSIDQKRIGALGFSYGGYTVIALSGGVLNYNTLREYFNTDQGRRDLANIREFPNLAGLIQGNSVIEMTQNLPDLKDDRINAFFAISPGTAQGFSEPQQFEKVNDPVFIIGCKADQVTPVKSYARHYHDLIDHSNYFEFGGKVGHYVMLAEANEEVKKKVPAIFMDHPSVDRNAVHQKIAELATSFFEKNLK